MSVRHGLLAILAEEPAHGYALKSRFEAGTAGAWPLNVGQVYTTLARLERDGLVRPVEGGTPKRQSWRITPDGRESLADWYRSPVPADPPARDELAIKVLLAVAAGDVDVDEILQQQRTATLTRLQDLTRRKQEADPGTQLAWVLLLDNLILKAEAEMRWVELCEQRLAHRDRRA